jgi:hypothetical protein
MVEQLVSKSISLLIYSLPRGGPTGPCGVPRCVGKKNMKVANCGATFRLLHCVLASLIFAFAKIKVAEWTRPLFPPREERARASLC